MGADGPQAAVEAIAGGAHGFHVVLLSLFYLFTSREGLRQVYDGIVGPPYKYNFNR